MLPVGDTFRSLILLVLLGLLLLLLLGQTDSDTGRSLDRVGVEVGRAAQQ